MSKGSFPKRSLALCMILLMIIAIQLPAAAGAPGKAENRVIVVFDTKVLNQKALSNLTAKLGGIYLKALPLIDGAAVALPANAAAHALRRVPGVIRVTEDIVVRALPAEAAKAPGSQGKRGGSTQPSETLPWGVDRIDAEQAWPADSTGAGVKVAVIDTGIDRDHPDLAGNLKGGILTINTGPYGRKSPSTGWDDDNGHGTHVAGIIAAVDNTIGVIGVGPSAALYGVKALDKNGSGYLSDIIEGIDWSIQQGMNVINMSLGTSVDHPDFYAAVQRAHGAGVSIVAAAGNSGPGENTVLYPARYSETIAVAALNQGDSLTSWSSRGPEVDLAAPGDSIRSTYKGDGYATLSGTSMAAPHVAGVAALYLAKYGPVSPETLRQALIDTAETVGGSPYPLIDALASVTGP